MRNELYLKSHLSFFITKIEKDNTECVGVYNSDAFFICPKDKEVEQWQRHSDQEKPTSD